MKTRILTVILFFLVVISYGQFSEAEKKLLYPKQYTFDQAEVFEKEGNFDKAIWFYINLYPENREKVVEKVNQFKLKNDSINLRSFIINSFSLYSVFDPTIANWDKGYPELNKENLDLKGSWGDALIAEFDKEDYSTMEVIPIKTRKGFMIIFNYDNSKSSLRIEGKDPKLSEPYLTFLVDNRALQITIANVSDISDLKKCKNRIDTLKAHKKYEIKYLSKILNDDLIVKEEEILIISGVEYFLWSYSLPSKLNVELENQYLMTTIIGDKIIMFHTASKSNEKDKSIKKYLIKFASSLKVYDDKMDIDKIIDDVKNE